MVFYRKYRPQIIDQLDNAQVRESLTAVLSKDVPHAFLFTGPKGLGKTSAARIVAKAVNCEARTHDSSSVSKKGQRAQNHQETIEPCNACEQCISITNGTNMDVIEIDAASNRGIDEIRELKDKIRLAPLAAKKKVYIIDEVHMLTTEAFNALLKTLEEPPAYTLFVLCTTEPHKIPATILSRCFHIAFSKATEEELVRSFRRIADSEMLEVDDTTLRLVAGLADGGFRDGAKILEELTTHAKDGKVTKELLESKYQVASIRYQVEEMIAALVKKDAKGALILIGTIATQGIDMRYFVEQLIESLHSILLVKVGILQEGRSKKHEVSIEEIKKLFQLLSRAHGEIKYAVVPQLPLELAVLEYVVNKQEGKVDKREEKRIDEQKSTDSGGKTVASVRKDVSAMQKARILSGEEEKKEEKKEVEVSGVRLTDFTKDGELTREWLDDFWKAVIIKMKEYNHTVAGVLRGCVLKSFDRKAIVIETAFVFHKDRLSEAKTLDALEKIASELTGKKVSAEVVLKGKS